MNLSNHLPFEGVTHQSGLLEGFLGQVTYAEIGELSAHGGGGVYLCDGRYL